MIRYKLYQNTNKKNEKAFGKWFPRPLIDETIGLTQLARHMAEHNSGFSEAMCLGVIAAMRRCIKEQILEGKNVKIDDLCIFSAGIKSNGGAASEDEFNLTKNVKGMRLRSRATGSLSNSKLSLEATLKRANAVITPSGNGTTPAPTPPAEG